VAVALRAQYAARMSKLEPIALALIAIIAMGILVAIAASIIALRGQQIDQWMKEVVIMVITYLAGVMTPSRRDPHVPTTVVVDSKGSP